VEPVDKALDILLRLRKHPEVRVVDVSRELGIGDRSPACPHWPSAASRGAVRRAAVGSGIMPTLRAEIYG